MSAVQAVSTLLASLILPWVVQLIKTEAITGDVARWCAIGLSLVAGVAVGLAGGMPESAGDMVTCILAVVGGVQVAYTSFKQVGITSKWMDALLTVDLDNDKEAK